MNSPIQSAEATVTNSGNRAMSSINNFINSNTLVSKVVFIILIVIGFVIALQFGTTLLGYIFEPASSPVLVSGMKDAKKVLKVAQTESGMENEKFVSSQLFQRESDKSSLSGALEEIQASL